MQSREGAEYSVSDALKCMRDDNVSGHVVSNEDCASLAAALAQRRVKDSVPHKTLAKAIAPLADRCFRMGKELHLMLIGCNTIKAVPHLKRAIPANAQGVVTVLCTSEVWPSDCSTMLYGALARTKDLNSFRAQTCALLGTYTDHYQRQSIQSESHCAHASLEKEGQGGTLQLQERQRHQDREDDRQEDG